jgi:hypothetical protein
MVNVHCASTSARLQRLLTGLGKGAAEVNGARQLAENGQAQRSRLITRNQLGLQWLHRYSTYRSGTSRMESPNQWSWTQCGNLGQGRILPTSGADNNKQRYTRIPACVSPEGHKCRTGKGGLMCACALTRRAAVAHNAHPPQKVYLVDAPPNPNTYSCSPSSPCKHAVNLNSSMVFLANRP